MKKIYKLFLIFLLLFNFTAYGYSQENLNNAKPKNNSNINTMNPQKNKNQKKQGEIHPLVIMSDFGIVDGAVSAMKGVAYSVSNKLPIFDLSHNIEPYNIWEGAYRLYQVVDFWEAGTVFVSIVDPGVGTTRKSIVAKAKNGQYFVNPNNGLLTLISEHLGIAEIREIDEKVNRLPNSYDSYTFHGRDVYVYTAARLASGTISFEQVGAPIPLNELEVIAYQKPIINNNVIQGNIPVLDINYGNVWSNIPKEMFDQLNPKIGDIFEVVISYQNKEVYRGQLPYYNTFGGVKAGEGLIYFNSLMNLSFALNEKSFAEKYKIQSGNEWSVKITTIAKKSN